MRRLSLLALALVAGPAALSAQVADTARADTMPRIAISIAKRHLWVISPAGDTVFDAPVAVGSGRTLRNGDTTWTFRTPTGETVVIAKEEAPVWVPPDWHYVELAKKLKLRLAPLHVARPVPLDDDRHLVVRGAVIGVLGPDSLFRELPGDEEVIFDGTLYIPPFGTRNRRVDGTLGFHRLLLANRVGIHGTQAKESIGTAATHGCIRMHDEDIRWLFEHIPVGARVWIR